MSIYSAVQLFTRMMEFPIWLDVPFSNQNVISNPVKAASMKKNNYLVVSKLQNLIVCIKIKKMEIGPNKLGLRDMASWIFQNYRFFNKLYWFLTTKISKTKHIRI